MYGMYGTYLPVLALPKDSMRGLLFKTRSTTYVANHHIEGRNMRNRVGHQ